RRPGFAATDRSRAVVRGQAGSALHGAPCPPARRYRSAATDASAAEVPRPESRLQHRQSKTRTGLRAEGSLRRRNERNPGVVQGTEKELANCSRGSGHERITWKTGGGSS